jgi:hypothetical protein
MVRNIASVCFCVLFLAHVGAAEADSNSSCDATKMPLEPSSVLPSMLSSADEALLGRMERDLLDRWNKPVPSPNVDFDAFGEYRSSRSFRERSVKSRAILTGDVSVLSSGSVAGNVPETQLPHLV